MDYIEVSATITPYSKENCEILIANLSNISFESFTETENGILAYIQEKLFNAEQLNALHNCILNNVTINFEHQLIKAQNWNAIWESNFEPIVVENKCIVRAPFHEINSQYQFEIIIEPKMSFGTGHHETTYLMMSQILNENFEGKKILDMGCGTAVLAILASKLNASEVLAIDNDNWAYQNSIENCARNNCPNITVKEGDATLLKDLNFDVILANINRNILLTDITAYSKVLNKSGTLIMSGFYTHDLSFIAEKCLKHSLSFVSSRNRNNWVVAKFNKI